MRLLVAGSRDLTDRAQVFRVLDWVHARTPVSVLIQGGARGADSLAKEWAESRGVPVESFPADWGKHGKRAGPLRNARMLREGCPDLVVAFSGGRGTADMVRQAEAAGVRVIREGF